MDHSEFKIGGAFSVSERTLWLCTDVGTRTVIAVRLDQDEVVTITVQSDGSESPEVRSMVNPRLDPTWLSGPPYAVAEIVFDEYDLPDCEPVAEGEVLGWVAKLD